MLSYYWSTPHLQTPPIITASIGRWTRISALTQAAQIEWCIILDIRFCIGNSWCISLVQKFAVWCSDALCSSTWRVSHCTDCDAVNGVVRELGRKQWSGTMYSTGLAQRVKCNGLSQRHVLWNSQLSEQQKRVQNPLYTAITTSTHLR